MLFNRNLRLEKLGGGWMYVSIEIHPCVLQDIGPLGLLPKKAEKIPHICESIGHRPLRGRYPKRARKEGWTSEIAKSDHIQKSPLVDQSNVLI